MNISHINVSEFHVINVLPRLIRINEISPAETSYALWYPEVALQ